MPALPTPDALDRTTREVLDRLGVTVAAGDGLQGRTPITGTAHRRRPGAGHARRRRRRRRPGHRRLPHVAHRRRRPVRGQLVRALGEELRAHKDDLGALVTPGGRARSAPRAWARSRR